MMANLHNLFSFIGCVFLFGVFLLFSLHMGNIRVATLNVNGARNSVKRMEVYDLMRQKQLDVLFLQETHSDDKNTAELIKEWSGPIF